MPQTQVKLWKSDRESPGNRIYLPEAAFCDLRAPTRPKVFKERQVGSIRSSGECRQAGINPVVTTQKLKRSQKMGTQPRCENPWPLTRKGIVDQRANTIHIVTHQARSPQTMDRTLENSAEHRLFTLRSGAQTERQLKRPRKTLFWVSGVRNDTDYWNPDKVFFIIAVAGSSITRSHPKAELPPLLMHGQKYVLSLR